MNFLQRLFHIHDYDVINQEPVELTIRDMNGEPALRRGVAVIKRCTCLECFDEIAYLDFGTYKYDVSVEYIRHGIERKHNKSYD